MLIDYHVHSTFSPDAQNSMEEMVQAARAAGMNEMAITDHRDPCCPERQFPGPDFPKYHAEITRIQESLPADFKLRRGLEIGVQNNEEALEACRQLARAYDYDYLIGSCHCCGGYELYLRNIFKRYTPEEAFRIYYEELYGWLQKFDDFDCIGHLNVVSRYAPVQADSKSYMDIVDEILKLAVHKGKGLEWNTSTFRVDSPFTMPTKQMLLRYRELGGEIITTGSDAHNAAQVGDSIQLATQLLQAYGFKYICTFERHKPTFHKLDTEALYK